MNDFKTSEEMKPDGSLAEDNKLKISVMNFKNQSNIFTEGNLNSLMDIINSTLTEKDILATVNSPEGSENLNPPEVMLIATEANSSFVINGLVFSEGQKTF